MQNTNYAYDHSGGSCASREQSQACLSYAEMEQRRRSQRRLKLTGDNKLLDVNADFMATYTLLNEPTLYPSAYMVLTNKGYTKHYYAGTERVAARIGGGCLDINSIVTEDNPALRSQASKLFEQSIDRIRRRTLQENDLGCIMNNGFAQPEFNYLILDIPNKLVADVEPACKEIGGMIYRMVKHCENKEPDVFFYHSDHLGSASCKKERFGKPFASERAEEARSGMPYISSTAVQHLQYLPFGEPYVNQRISGYSERFTFTGKERDEETGYGYFGARYMDHEILTSFISVDRYASKYPSINPYAYCAWNPIILTDPSGDTIINKYLQYKDSKGYYGELYVRTQQLIDEFQTSHPEEFDYLNNISFENENGECTPINIFIGVSDEKGPINPSTGTRANGHTVYQFNYDPVDCYDEKGRYTQRLDVVGIKDNKFSITLYKHHHNIATLANEFGDVIFGVLRSQTVHDQRNLGYYKKATTIFSFDYEEFIMGKRATCPNPFDEKEYR